MVFNSFSFIFIFFPVTVTGFFLLGRKSKQWATSWLTLASLFFYGWWDYRYLPLLLISALFNYWAGQHILHAHQIHIRKRWLTIAVTINLLLLGYFKYVDFFIQTMNDLAGRNIPLLKIVLPVGISFFSFTQIAFLADAYSNKIKKVSLFPYLSFVTYFPYIVSGPILDYKEMEPQLAPPLEPQSTNAEKVHLKAENVALGMAIFVCGLAKKVLIADNLVPLVSPAFSEHHPQLIQVWLGLLAYSFQLYFDFSGYSDMAIGGSRIMGIELPLNFNSPYKATSISDFWQRWHMSLSRFLRNYLYIPLGGNRCGQLNRYRNLMVTMLLGGLWHGANWTFVIWGGLHGVYLCIQHGWQKLWPKDTTRPSAATRLIYRLLTLFAVLIAWCFFRAPNVTTALDVLAGLIGKNGLSLVIGVDPFAAGTLVVSAFMAFCLPNSQEIFSSLAPCLDNHDTHKKDGNSYSMIRLHWSPNIQWGIVTGILFALCMLGLDRISGFIYVQF